MKARPRWKLHGFPWFSMVFHRFSNVFHRFFIIFPWFLIISTVFFHGFFLHF